MTNYIEGLINGFQCVIADIDACDSEAKNSSLQDLKQLLFHRVKFYQSAAALTDSDYQITEGFRKFIRSIENTDSNQ